MQPTVARWVWAFLGHFAPRSLTLMSSAGPPPRLGLRQNCIEEQKTSQAADIHRSVGHAKYRRGRAGACSGAQEAARVRRCLTQCNTRTAQGLRLRGLVQSSLSPLSKQAKLGACAAPRRCVRESKACGARSPTMRPLTKTRLKVGPEDAREVEEDDLRLERPSWIRWSTLTPYRCKAHNGQ